MPRASPLPKKLLIIFSINDKPPDSDLSTTCLLLPDHRGHRRYLEHPDRAHPLENLGLLIINPLFIPTRHRDRPDSDRYGQRPDRFTFSVREVFFWVFIGTLESTLPLEELAFRLGEFSMPYPASFHFGEFYVSVCFPSQCGQTH